MYKRQLHGRLAAFTRAQRCRKSKFLSSLVHISWCVVCLSSISPVNNESGKNGGRYKEEELLYGTVIISLLSVLESRNTFVAGEF